VSNVKEYFHRRTCINIVITLERSVSSTFILEFSVYMSITQFSLVVPSFCETRTKRSVEVYMGKNLHLPLRQTCTGNERSWLNVIRSITELASINLVSYF
jgi:hypothetical protein